MKAVVLKDFKTAALSVEEIPTPTSKRGQVLIKMAAAPINPSDLVFLRNQYGIKKKLPIVPGFEGSGIVVSANAGLYGRWLVGKRVACHAPEDGNGTWAEYMTVEAGTVAPLCKEISFEAGASLLVNPLTAWVLLTMVKESGHRAFVQTAAASALGRMMERLGRRWGLTSINIVRRREQVELMKTEGAVHVLDTSQPGWQDQLKVLCATHHVRIALDAVGGELTAHVAQSMEMDARVVVYGGLAGENFQMNSASLIFEGKRLEGFWVTEWVKHQSFWRKMMAMRTCQKYLNTELKTDVQGKFPLNQIQEALALYKQNRSAGKVLLVP